MSFKALWGAFIGLSREGVRVLVERGLLLAEQ